MVDEALVTFPNRTTIMQLANTSIIMNNHTIAAALVLMFHNDTASSGDGFVGALSSSLVRFNAALRYIILALALTILTANSIVLAAFVKHRCLRTPFNVYLISLIGAGIGQSLFDLPFLVMSEFIPVWPLGEIGCNFYMYAKWIFPAAVRNTHSMISLNRVWALFWPLSYRRVHTKVLAIWLCIGTWTYVHAWLLPGLLLDDLYYRFDRDGSCQVNTTALGRHVKHEAQFVHYYYYYFNRACTFKSALINRQFLVFIIFLVQFLCGL